MIAKEQHKLEVLKRRQEREIQQVKAMYSTLPSSTCMCMLYCLCASMFACSHPDCCAPMLPC